MTIESYIAAMPKVELSVQFEGALNRETLLLIAEENDIPENLKHFKQWVQLLDRPDYAHLDDLLRTVTQWIIQPEDLTRLVYDLGVALSKQNVRYAEVGINPLLYVERGLTFEQFLGAINDGRDRVERAWKVRLCWVLNVPRDQPRKADDIIRWASSVSAKKGHVVGIGLFGREDTQTIDQFERAFRTAQKKDIPRLPRVSDDYDADGIQIVLQNLEPDRLLGGWRATESPEVLRALSGRHVTLDLCLSRAVRGGKLASYANYPLRQLYDDGAAFTLTSEMPNLYKTDLNKEYAAVVSQCGFSVDELETIALHAVRASMLEDDEKQAMLNTFKADYERLRTEHGITADVTA